MTFKQFQKYQKQSSKFKGKGDMLYMFPLMGLCGEAGEVAEKFKKIFRDNNGKITPELKAELIKELGDVLWYISEISAILKVTLDTVAKTNVIKINDRINRNKLTGKGDNR